MNRSTFRNVWITSVALLLGSSFWLYQMYEAQRLEIQSAETMQEQLARERQASRDTSADLSRLDKLTIDERKTTTLDIIRHLEIAEPKNVLPYSTTSRVEKVVGTTTLYVRQFSLTTKMSYSQAMGEVARFYRMGKVVINRVSVEPISGTYDDTVNMKIEGTLYGLQKNG